MSLFVGLITCTFWLAFAQEDGLPQSIKRGQEIYIANCASCHMPAGEGVEGAFPPLAKTAYLKNQKRAIGIVLNGQEGGITVNGKQYNVPMAALGHLSDKEIADVLNFVSNSWGNKNPVIKPAQVKAERK
ncbi:MAG: major anaerobically induced transrane protein [Ferruginibacter sp.]|nr:major anaerobically induced transrane protein [Ferruginibacter sp.]